MTTVAIPPGDQTEVTWLCARTGVLLLRNGAESALVESVARRLGLALGMDSVEIALIAGGITVTTIRDGRGDTTVLRNAGQDVDMHVVTEVQRTILLAEEGKLDLTGVAGRLEGIKSMPYPPLLVAVGIGLSCASFARLALLAGGGAAGSTDFGTPALTFAASTVAMLARQSLARRRFDPLINFAVSALVATSIAAQGQIHHWVANPKIAMAACVLLFVPGFPLINAVSDMVKGYVNTGIARGVTAVLLLTACSGGIMLAMAVWGAWTWL